MTEGNRFLPRQSVRVAVSGGSQVSEARRIATEFADRLGFSEAKRADLALMATEAATNLVKHTPHGGEVLLNALIWQNVNGIEMLALDSGPGIRSPAKALEDGYSTAGSAGTGLGAIRRKSDFFELHSRPERGTALLARLWSAPLATGRARVAGAGLELGAVRVPYPGETVSGDDWADGEDRGRSLMMLVDGLGHGAWANEAATEAIKSFRLNLGLAPAEIIDAIHQSLRHTRGGVAAVAEVSAARDRLTFAGTGNISGILLSPEGQRNMVSQPGTLGQELRKVLTFDYPWSPESLLILHSDGLTSRLDFSRHQDLRSRSPALIAGVLYQEYKRGRDDAAVLVAREARD